MILIDELLKYLSDNGNMDLLLQAQKELEMKKRNDLLAKHDKSIWQNDQGYWYTRINGKLIKKRNKEDLENVILEYVEDAELITVSDLFEEYLARLSIKPSTEYRYRNDFKRFYQATEWDRKDITKISAEEFSDFIEDEISRNNLDPKGLQKLKGITTGIIKRAKKRRLIDYTQTMVYDMVDLSPRKKRHDKTKEVITEREVQAFMRYVEENQTIVNLALLFMLVSGLRVGEMVTLEYKDFISPTSFIVSKSETFYKKKDGEWAYEVSDTKTEAGIRTAYIPKSYLWIVKKMKELRPFSTFLCTDDKGERIRSYSLRNHLYGICRRLPEFCDVKSTHKLRKTFCSILLDSGFDNNLITSVMGHTNINTSENFYHFDRKSRSKKQEMMDNIVEFQIC